MVNYMRYIEAQREGDLGGVTEAKKAATDVLMNMVMDAIANKAVGYKNDPATLSPQTPYIHGAGGLLSNPGQSPAMLSTIIRPIGGMVNELPRVDSGTLYPVEMGGKEYGGEDVPFITTITGVTSGDLDSFTNQPDGLCDDPPVAGLLKACTQTAPFGRFSAALRQLDRTRLGRLNNRGETTDFNIMNRLQTDDPLLPTEANGNLNGGWINDEIASRVFEAGIGFQRLVAPLTYSGTPLNDKAGGGARQFLGFNNIYITGRRDAFTGLLCAAMDSYNVAFNANITSTNLQGLYLYQLLEDIYFYLTDLAEFTGLNPTEWCISMDKDLWRALCQIVPVQQYVRVITQMAAINTTSKDGGQLHFGGEETNRLRQEMYTNKTLPLNGDLVKVVVESGATIGRTYNAATATATSSIYFHPMRVLGSVPVTYWQFFNHANNQGAAYDAMVSKGLTWTTDGGKFLWSSSFRNFCGQISWLTEPRIMSHAPQLGAVVSGVEYTPGVFTRSPYPSDSSFFIDGGRTSGDVLYGTPSWSSGASVALGVTD